jgi:hypothetical protein
VKHATRPGTVYGTPARVVSLHCISPVMADFVAKVFLHSWRCGDHKSPVHLRPFNNKSSATIHTENSASLFMTWDH